MATKQMQRLMALKADAIKQQLIHVTEKMNQEKETALVPYNGGFVAYPTEFIQGKFGVMNSQLFNVNVMRGAGTMDTQGATPGHAFPQFPTTLVYNDQREVTQAFAERFCETAIILHNGQHFDKTDEMIPKPEAFSDEALIKLGEKFAETEFPPEFTKRFEGCCNKLSNPFAEAELPAYVEKIFQSYFPDLKKEEHVLLFIGDLPTMIAVAKYHLLGAENVNKYNTIKKKGVVLETANHKLYVAKKTIAVPFENAHLMKSSEGKLAYMRPVFHGSNTVFINKEGSLPYEVDDEPYHTVAVKEYLALHKLLISKADEMEQFAANKFMGLTAASIALETPFMANVEVVDEAENPLMILNGRLDVVNSLAVLHSTINPNVKVDEADCFTLAYASTMQKSMFSHCKALSYRNSFEDEAKPFQVEAVKEYDSKGRPIKQIYNHNTDRACSVDSYIKGLESLPAGVSEEYRQLEASMLSSTNNMLQLFDSHSGFSASMLESRSEAFKRQDVIIEDSKKKEVGWMCALKSAPEVMQRYMYDPSFRTMAKLGGSIFRMKGVVKQILFLLQSKIKVKPGCDHPGMIAQQKLDADFCEFCEMKFITSSDNFCRCAAYLTLPCVLKDDQAQTPLKLVDAWNNIFAIEAADAQEKKPKNAKMEPYGFNLSMRSDDYKSQLASSGNATFCNKLDEYGFVSKELYEERKKKKEKRDEENKKNKDGAGETPAATTSAEKDDDEGGTDFSKCKKLSSLVAKVMNKAGTILPAGHYVDFSEMSPEEIEELPNNLKAAHQIFNSSVKMLFELEKNDNESRNNLGAFCFAPELALLQNVVKDSSAQKDYSIPSFQQGSDEIKIKGTAEAVKESPVASPEKITLLEQDDDAEDELIQQLEQQENNKRKRQDESEEEKRRSKKQRIEKITDDVKHTVVAMYEYAVRCIQDPALLADFTVSKIPETYRHVLNNKLHDVATYIRQRLAVNFEAIAKDDRLFGNVYEDTMVEQAEAVGLYFKKVAEIVQEECCFTTPEIMHDRFTNHVSLTQKKIDKEMPCLIDPSSTSSYMQRTSEMKILAMMGKQSRDVATVLDKPCPATTANIKSVMTNMNVPHVATTEIPIPYLFPTKTTDPVTGCDVMTFPAPNTTNMHAIPPVKQSIYSTLITKVKLVSLAEDRKEVANEKWDDSTKTNTKKLENELSRIAESPEIGGGVYTLYPLTCKDHTDNGGGYSGAGTFGPLCTAILALSHNKNQVRFDKVANPDFSNNKQCLRGVEFILHFVEEMLGTKQANNEISQFSTLAKQVVGNLQKIDIAHNMVVEKMIRLMVLFKSSLKPHTPKQIKALNKLVSELFVSPEKQSIGERFNKNFLNMITRNPTVVPQLHLLFTTSQIYGAKNNVEGKLYNAEMERDMQAALVATAAVTRLVTTHEELDSVTAANSKQKQMGLSTLIKCHSNYSMVSGKPVTLCSMGDHQYVAQSRTIFKGAIGSYPGMNAELINRSIKMNKTFFSHSLPAMVVNQGVPMISTGASVMIKTGVIHNTKKTYVAKSINPAEVLSTGDLHYIASIVGNSKNIAKKFAEYIKAILYSDMLPADMDALVQDIVDNFMSGYSDAVARRGLEDSFVKFVAPYILADYDSEDDDEECDMDYSLF